MDRRNLCWRSIGHAIFATAIAAAALIPLTKVQAAGSEPQDGLFTTGEAGHPMHGGRLIFNKKGQAVVGIYATPYGIHCYRGTLGDSEILVAKAVRREENYQTNQISFGPVFEGDQYHFNPLRILTPIKPYPDPRAMFQTSKQILDRDMKWLTECRDYFRETKEPVKDPSREAKACSPIPLRLDDSKSQIEANRQWLATIQVFEKFYDQQRQQMDHNRAETIARAVIAHQFLSIAEITRDERASDGLWSRELARESLSALAAEVKAGRDNWLELRGEQGLLEELYCFPMDDILGIPFAEEHCAQTEIGNVHLAKHLKPFLRTYLAQKLSLGLEGCDEERVKRLAAIFDAVVVEHESFISNAVVPGFDKVSEMGDGGRLLAKLLLPGKAQITRLEAARLAIGDLRDSGSLTASEYRSLMIHVQVREGIPP